MTISFDSMVVAMHACEQTAGQTVYAHGLSVQHHFLLLCDYLDGLPLTGWKLPDWIDKYRDDLRPIVHAAMEDVILYTLYHDCGKPFCKVVDKDTGRTHFPDHANVSSQIWSGVSKNEKVGRWISQDMALHTLTADEIGVKLRDEWNLEDSVVLLLVGLSEIHSNAKMFGGTESTSFKIKWKTLEKRGKQVLKHWFPHSHSSTSTMPVLNN